ncbi:uncharacterized protein LOC120329091 [Styela clava]
MEGFKHDHMDSLNRYREYKKFWERHRIPGEFKDKRMLWTDPGYQPMFSSKKKDKKTSCKLRSLSSSPDKQSKNKKVASVTTISITTNGISDSKTKKMVLENTNQQQVSNNEKESSSVSFRLQQMKQEQKSKVDNENATKTEHSGSDKNKMKDGNPKKTIIDQSKISKEKLSNGRHSSSSSSSDSN